MGKPRRCTATSPRRCSMARRRASMREGPLAELFRATEAAQRQADQEAEPEPKQEEPEERTVEHVPTWEETARPEPTPPPPSPDPKPPAPTPVPPPRPPDPDPPQIAARYLEPLPESPARLIRAGADTGAYLAVI